jgi:hypothetical protein
MVATLFARNDELTAIFLLIGVVCFVLAAFAGPRLGRRAGGSIGLVGLGLAFVYFPTMWETMDAAF